MLKILSLWWRAIRPHTLTASVAPVFLGTAMAYGDGAVHWPSAVLALICALFIQIGTNLSNDYFDLKSGVDTKERRGPLSVTLLGLILPQHVKWGFILCFSLAGFFAAFLLARGGWPVLIIGMTSILSGIFYTAGPKPLSHLGLGDIFVLIFFGPVAVGGTYYVQSLGCNAAVVLMGFACGLFSTAILIVNNLRDIATDKTAGKMTLAVRFGANFTRIEYLTCLLAACAVPLLVYLITGHSPWIMIASGIIFLCVPLIRTVFTSDSSQRLNQTLALTGIVLSLFCILFSIGWIL
ncbi:MAG: 1,4-dihydroxy-2-naphthoate polyprenyltransferase [Candidatus Omnitrophica bacterium]|nr:1,4-dihydroxy-2-naphthoate polyprenyltransferase [Candidatus Omnitrophota bacterium]